MGVPVFYLPFFSQADPTVRHKSGFLLPDFGSSSTLGTFLKAPYYISLDPSRDLTLSPYITSGAGNVLQTEFRQRLANGGFWLQADIGYDDHNRQNWFSSLFGSGRFGLADGWRTGFDVQLTSNDTYLQRYEISYLDRLTTNLFVDRVVGRSRFALDGYFFQSLRATDVTGEIPLALPLAEVTYIPEEKIAGGRLRVDGSALMLSRDVGTDMIRGSTSMDFRRPFVTNDGQLITLEAFGRGDVYRINDATFSQPLAPHDSETIGRALGLAMLEWRYPFMRDMGIGDTRLVIEPIAQLVAASSGGNPRGLPNEDSTSVEFDATNLFSPNQVPGLDLWTGGPRSNVGIRGTILLPEGTIEATLGQDFRFVPDPNLPPALGIGGDKSDIVGQLKIDLPPALTLTHQFNIDPGSGTLRRNEVYLKAQLGQSSISLSYLKLPFTAADPTLGEQEQVYLDTTIFFLDNWAVFAGARRDLAKAQMIESSIGLRYEDECFIASFGFHRRDTATLNLKPASAVIFRLGLKTGLTGG
jgi:LPS-assembly protein